MRSMAAAREGSDRGAERRRDRRAEILERAADLLEQRRSAFHRAAAARGRQDARRRALRSPRGRRFLPLLCRRGPRSCSATARPCRDRPARAMCCELRGRGVFVAISPWNFPLAIFLGQVAAALMAGNAVVAKPAEQTPLIAAEAVRLLHEAGVPASALHLVPGDGNDRRGAGGARRHRRRRLHRLDRGRAVDQPHARRQGRPDRAADRGNRRHQRDDRRCHRAARAGCRRCRDLGVPLRRPALLGAAAAVRAGRRRRPHDRDDRRRRPRTADRRPARSRHPCRAGDRRRGQSSGWRRISRG